MAVSEISGVAWAASAAGVFKDEGPLLISGENIIGAIVVGRIGEGTTGIVGGVTSGVDTGGVAGVTVGCVCVIGGDNARCSGTTGALTVCISSDATVPIWINSGVIPPRPAIASTLRLSFKVPLFTPKLLKSTFASSTDATLIPCASNCPAAIFCTNCWYPWWLLKSWLWSIPKICRTSVSIPLAKTFFFSSAACLAELSAVMPHESLPKTSYPSRVTRTWTPLLTPNDPGTLTAGFNVITSPTWTRPFRSAPSWNFPNEKLFCPSSLKAACFFSA